MPPYAPKTRRSPGGSYFRAGQGGDVFQRLALGVDGEERRYDAAQDHRAGPEQVEAGVRELIIHDVDESRVAALLELLSDLGAGRVSAGPPDPAGCDLVFNATPMGLEDGDPLPVDAALLTSSMFVGDVIAGHGVTPFIQAAKGAGCQAANGEEMVEAGLDLMPDFLREVLLTQNGDTADASKR